MNKLSTILFLLITNCFFLQAQSTTLAVYQIFQEKCAACHDNANPQSGLDLEGVGATELERALYVRNNIVGVTPDNDHAATQGYEYISKGRADKSFLFRKINGDLEATIELDSDAGETMPPATEPQLTNEEKELVRQWLLYGAPEEGEVVDPQTIYNYYNVNGLDAFETPPLAPDPSEGFQIKVGPFFLNPAGEPLSEVEYYTKYEMELPADVDVNRLDIKISSYSHHMIVYRFDPGADTDTEHGFRLENNHNDIGIVASVQEASNIELPEGTAFVWENDVVLDLNPHYINYSATNTYKAEGYINVYTQTAGTAAQEMYTTLIPYFGINIPNDGNPISFVDDFTYPVGDIYVWSLGGHTHQYGTGYKIWKRLAGGGQGEILYDGSCPDGIPDCASPFFDYQHIPTRAFPSLISVNLTNGFLHEASYLNDGPNPVAWGPTSNDEMMLFGMMFVIDTSGLDLPVATNDPLQVLEGVRVFPNPMKEQAVFELPESDGGLRLIVYDMLGSAVHTVDKLVVKQYVLQRNKLTKGMYFYRVEDEQGKFTTGKLFVGE